jgi:hypothetical protein
MWTKEQRDEHFRQVLEAISPQPPPPKPTPTSKAQERWDKKPTEAVIQDATVHNHALAERMRNETAEQRRQRAYAKELAEWHAQGQDPRIKYQRQLGAWWQSKLDAEAALREDDYVMVGGFMERRYRSSCHRGRGDSDWGLK